MAISKVIYGNDVLVDLTSDTVAADRMLAGFTAHGADGEQITGTCDFDSNTQDATVLVAEMLKDKTAYARGVKIVGTMPNNGGISKTITKRDVAVNIPLGHHDGSGTVGLSEIDRAKLIPNNIREGVTILDITGTMSTMEGSNPQQKEVTASLVEDLTVLPDEGYTCLSEVIVKKIPYVESNNAAGGITVKIG